MTVQVVTGRRDRACDRCRCPIDARVRYVRIHALTEWRIYPHGVRMTISLCIRCGSRCGERPILNALREAGVAA